MADDTQLLRQYVETRSEAAFSAVVQRHVDLVYAAALRRTAGQRQFAEEVTQEVFCEVARKASSLANHPMLIAWLYSHTRFLALKCVRGEVRRKSREEQASALAAVDTPETSGDWHRLNPVIDQAMDALSAADRSAVLLRFFDGRTFAEIGGELGLTEDGARLRVNRALEKLRRVLARAGITSTAAGLAVVLSENVAMSAPAGLTTSVVSAATAAGATTAAGVTGTLAFMSLTKVAAVIAGAAAIGAVGTLIVQQQEIGRTRAALVAASDELARLQTQLGTETRAAADSETRLAEQRAKTIALAASGARANGVPAELIAGTTLYRNPDFQQALHERFRAEARLRYVGLYRSLGLSAPQIEAFENAVVARDTKLFEIDALARARGAESGDRESLRLRAEAEAEFRRGVAHLAPTEQLAAYDAAVDAREFTGKVASYLFQGESALTPVQFEALSHAVVANTRNGEVDWDRVMNDATPTLTPKQLAAIAAARNARESNRQFQQAYAQAIRAPQPTSAIP